MTRLSRTAAITTLIGLTIALPTACSGSDGAPGQVGPAGPTAINASATSFELLSQLDVVSTITRVSIQSPPVVTFRMATAEGVPITGLVPYYTANNRFVRFTITKLVPGQNGDPDAWVAYVRDGGEPDYDTGDSLVDNQDGTYTFTFKTDVKNVAGVSYDGALTHRVAGQVGQYSTVPLEEQNLWYDFVPNGAPLTRTRNIAVMQSCNECHTNLVFHGRRFETEYCVQCHNQDLAQGEGDFGFMIHRIHNAGTFRVLDGGVSFAEVTYPQEVINCRKCHNGDDVATAQGNNWRTKPSMIGCDGCHDIFLPNHQNTHSGPVVQTSNAVCAQCHTPEDITQKHATPNATPNNPELLPGQHDIAYELLDAAVDGSNNVTVRFKITSDGAPLDVTNLPPEFKNGSGAAFRYPGFLLAYAMPQSGMATPADWNNLGRASAQPLSLGLNSFGPINTTSPIGTLTFDAGSGVMTAVVTATASQFPVGATLRTVGLQGYLQQDLDGDGSSDVSLHAVSVVEPVAGDQVRRAIIDTTKCASCHEWFEGHGGNRVFAAGSDLVCSMCHVPNLSSSGRTLDLIHPEDSQNFKDMIHGIHAAADRTRKFEHVRNFNNSARVYDWSHVTFPRGASTSSCLTCHLPGTYGLPLTANVLPTTVRTTGVTTGADPTPAAVATARGGTALPNATDWVNSATASSCFYCHTSLDAWGHMTQNGGLLTVPDVGPWTNRSGLVGSLESCTICHGPGRIADLDVVHNKR